FLVQPFERHTVGFGRVQRAVDDPVQHILDGMARIDGLGRSPQRGLALRPALRRLPRALGFPEEAGGVDRERGAGRELGGELEVGGPVAAARLARREEDRAERAASGPERDQNPRTQPQPHQEFEVLPVRGTALELRRPELGEEARFAREDRAVETLADGRTQRLPLRAVPDLGRPDRVAVRDVHAPEPAPVVRDVHRAPIRELRDHDPRDLREGVFKIEGGGKDTAGLSQGTESSLRGVVHTRLRWLEVHEPRLRPGRPAEAGRALPSITRDRDRYNNFIGYVGAAHGRRSVRAAYLAG